MGIFGVIGKVTSSKIVEKVETELTKKQNREQTSGYCKYIKANLSRVSKMIAELENETRMLIEQIQTGKGVRLSFREKSDFRKVKENADKNLEYLYLIRDFFTILAKNASGLILKNEELMLVTKFAPYFDGVSVLEVDDDENRDDSLLAGFKEIGQGLKNVFGSSKKSSDHFDFDEYLQRYSKKIDQYIMPDIAGAIESFNNTMALQETQGAPVADVPVTVPVTLAGEIECPNCHAKLAANAKFCPECGNKIEAKQPAFCTECGEPIKPGAKFCSGCGAEIVSVTVPECKEK